MESAELLLSKLAQEDIQTLTQYVSEYFVLPVMLVDTEYRGISFYPRQPLNDPIWDEIYQHNRVSPTIVNQLNLTT